MTELTDEDLKQQLAKHGVDSGPIVGEFIVAFDSSELRQHKTSNLPIILRKT